jgi:hypothetical protein
MDFDAALTRARPYGVRMNQIIRELKRQFAGEKLEPEQLKGLIRAGYVYRNGDEHLLTEKGRGALAQLGVHPGAANDPDDGTLGTSRRQYSARMTLHVLPGAHGRARTGSLARRERDRGRTVRVAWFWVLLAGANLSKPAG